MYMRFQLLLIVTLAALVVLSQGQEVSECKNILRSCHVYPKKRYCTSEKYRSFMERYCAKYCGFCDCNNWIYGCCRDRKTHADGPSGQGCALKLCYDVFVDGCPQSKKDGLCTSSSRQTRASMKETCPYSCGFCKHLAPSKSQCVHSQYGCCWDGTYAVGPNHKGCRACVDAYPHSCRQFAFDQCSNTGAYYTRTFLEEYCPKSCRVCPVGCHDRAGESKCIQWFIRGYCRNSIWKPYMMDSCAKTCDFCKEEGIIA